MSHFSALAVVPDRIDDEEDEGQPTLGQQIKLLRDQIGFSQMDVAKLVGCDVGTISRWERNRHQHTHKSKDRAIRAAFEALSWAVELQIEEPMRALSLQEVQEYVLRRKRARRGGRSST